MKIALLSVVLLAAAACSNGEQDEGTRGGASPTAAPTSDTSAPSGEVIYESDFSSAENGLFGGQPLFFDPGPGGGASVAGRYTPDGTLLLQATIPPKHELFSLNSNANTGGVFSGERELVDLADTTTQVFAAPKEWETGIAYGVQCRAQTDDPGKHYEASIGLDDFSNEVFLFRNNGSEPPEELGRAPLPSSAETGSEYNLLRLDCIGDQITFYVNGEEVLSATDSTYTEGMAAFFVGAYVPGDLGEENPGATASANFDNAEIREL